MKILGKLYPAHRPCGLVLPGSERLQSYIYSLTWAPLPDWSPTHESLKEPIDQDAKSPVSIASFSVITNKIPPPVKSVKFCRMLLATPLAPAYSSMP